MHTLNRQRGFTLLELTTVVAIAGTLSAVALPRYVDTIRSARVAKMDIARHAVNEAAQVYHLKWIMAGSPAATVVLDEVEMNANGYPTGAGILVAAGLAESYDTSVVGVIAVDAQHPQCSLAYFPESGTSQNRYADGAGC